VSIVQQLERVPPQNLEAEQGVLGSMLLDRDAIARAIEGLRADDFYRDAHRVIFQAMVELFERGEPVDLITVTNRLAANGKLEDVGGPTYVASLPNLVPTAANVDFYANIVLEKSMLRALISAGTHIAAMGYDGADDVAQMIDRAEKLVFGIASRRSVQDFEAIKEILKQSFEKIDRRYQEKGTITGVGTGFSDFDMLTSGLQAADMVIIAARPSVGKCLSADSEIVLEDGSVATIEEIYRRRQARLLTLDTDWKLRWTEPSAFVDDGIRPVFRITTKLGRSVECTASHPFRTLEGWIPLAALKVGDRIAVPRRIPVEGTKPMRECEIKVLAYLIGDGALTGNKANFTNTNPRLIDDFTSAVEEYGAVRVRREREKSDWRSPTFSIAGDPIAVFRNRAEFARRLRNVIGRRRGAQVAVARRLGVSPANVTFWIKGSNVPSAELFRRLCEALSVTPEDLAPHGLPAMSRSSKNPVVLDLIDHGIWNKRASEKNVPAAIFTLPQRQLALFLNRLYATDGCATASAATRNAKIVYTTTSERLGRHVQHLLLRFGIIGSLCRFSVQYKGGRRPYYQLNITDPRSIETFAHEIGIFGKEDNVAKVLAHVRSRTRHHSHADTVPRRVWRTIDAAKQLEPMASLARRAGFATATKAQLLRTNLSRIKLQAIARTLCHHYLALLSKSDIYWDTIKSIEPTGDKQVYDLTIPETHNFVANDIGTHNTTLALNIAQHAALDAKIPVAIFSLETSKEQLVQRILCSEAQVDNSKLRTGFLADEDWRKLARAMGGLSEAPIFIDDSATMSIIEMRAKARKLKAEHGLGLIVIDYIQMIQSYKRSENRTQELSEIARGIKSLAKELDVPIIAISQLSRAVEALGQKRPMLSHLRESGEIEQVSDLVVFLYREDYYDQEKAQKENKENICELIIAKHRNGPIGTVELYFHKEYSRFANLEKRRQ